MGSSRDSRTRQRRAGVAARVRRSFTRDDGVGAVTVAIALVVLLGMTAIALDGGNIYQERRSAQNAADQAVVAASYTECVGGTVTDAIDAGYAAAAENGFDDADPEITVTVTYEGSNKYRAEVSIDVESTFGRLIGASVLDVGASAVATCELGDGQVTALFANATACGGDELEITLNESEIIGGVHSNGDIGIPGDANHIDGGTTYGENFSSTGGPPSTFSPNPPGPQQTVTDADWPLEYDIAMYEPGGYFETELESLDLYQPFGTSQTFKDETVEGIYYVDGDITIQEGITVGPQGVTFVATGTIKTLEDNQTLSFFDHPENNKLLFFSTAGSGGCDETVVIDISGDNVDLTGIIFAPNGKADVTGDGSDSIAVWANFVHVTGDEFTIDAPTLDGFGPPDILLDE